MEHRLEDHDENRGDTMRPGTKGDGMRPAAPLAWAFASHLYREHPALLLTLGYLFLTAVGMSYEFVLFQQFNVNLFDYADATDFVLVALRNPPLLVFTLISTAIVRNAYRLHAWGLARSSHYREVSERMMSWRWYPAFERVSVTLILVGYFAILSGFYAQHNAAGIKSGEGRAIFVDLVSDVANGSTNHTPTGYLPLGSTSRYLLVFNPANGHTEVLPVNNVSRITLDVGFMRRRGMTP